MQQTRLSRDQHNAVLAAADGALKRNRDGWHGATGTIHSFQTVSSLERRGLLVGGDRRKAASLSNDGRLYVERRRAS
jgi:hypothetical protein